jgi:hypothetical protein
MYLPGTSRSQRQATRSGWLVRCGMRHHHKSTKEQHAATWQRGCGRCAGATDAHRFTLPRHCGGQPIPMALVQHPCNTICRGSSCAARRIQAPVEPATQGPPLLRAITDNLNQTRQGAGFVTGAIPRTNSPEINTIGGQARLVDLLAHKH